MSLKTFRVNLNFVISLILNLAALIVVSFRFTPMANAFEESEAVRAEDITVLFPLPQKDEEWNRYLTAASSGNKGLLVPQGVFQKIPPLLLGSHNDARLLKLMGFRLDPCFRETPVESGPCQIQLRAVWQLFSGSLSTRMLLDSTMHTFYELTPAEFSTALTFMQNLRRNSPSNSSVLSVHPVLAARGLSSEVFQNVSTLLLSLAGEKNSHRVTFMALKGRANEWEFGGFDRLPSGQWETHTIAGVEAPTQTVRNTAIPPTQFQGTFLEPTSSLWTLSAFLSGQSLMTLPAQQQLHLANAVAANLNPLKTGPGSVDCVSCHMAESAQIVSLSLNLLPLAEHEFVFPEPSFQADNPFGRLTSNFRAFGYFQKRPAVSLRVRNETAQILKSLNARAP
jgi:hypothetical protein